MKPVDALRLPAAQLTDDQRAHIARGIAEMETLFHKAMTRNGMSIDLAGDPVVIEEIRRHCIADGWIAETRPDLEPSRTYPGQMHLKGFKLILTPPPEAYAEINKERFS